jgi:nitric oxide reductase activation protein
MGRSLARRLRMLNDIDYTKYSREQSGTLDQGLIAELGVDNHAIFSRIVEEQRTPIVVYVSIDASSSMFGEKWQSALTLGVALAQCSAAIRMLDVNLSIRASELRTCIISTIYDSRYDTIRKIDLFKSLVPNGTTPEGLAFEAMMPDITRLTSNRIFFINISDGMPNHHQKYRGYVAFKHTAQQVQNLRRNNVRVLSYYIGKISSENKKNFILMYGKSAQFIQPNNINDIVRTLNSLFLHE